MKCACCGFELSGNEKFCPKCGSSQSTTSPLLFEQKAANRTTKPRYQYVRIVRNIINILVGIFLVVFFFVSKYDYFFSLESQYDISNATIQMQDINSVNGNTIEEKYYQLMGEALHGFSSMQSNILINSACICTMLNILYLVSGIVFINFGVAGLFSRKKE